MLQVLCILCLNICKSHPAITQNENLRTGTMACTVKPESYERGWTNSISMSAVSSRLK